MKNYFVLFLTYLLAVCVLILLTLAIYRVLSVPRQFSILPAIHTAQASPLPLIPAPKQPIATSSSIFSQYPQLRPVAACESMGSPTAIPRQFMPDGSILWGKEKNASGVTVTVQRDCGEFQINTKAHGRYPDGLDVCGSQADNIAYALILYQKRGLQDWFASESCWAKVESTD